jgi:2-keto-3-deoxy-L-rhamnonate aldolase RhmA
VCLVQIETAEAMAKLDSIAATPGVDGLFVGPQDLALSLGTPLGDVRDPRFREHVRAVAEAARGSGLIAGMFCGSVDAARAAREDGFDLLAIMSDVRLLRGAAVDALDALRGPQVVPPVPAAPSTSS